MVDGNAQPTRYEGENEGKSLEFACQSDAQAMTIGMVAAVVAN